MIHPRIVLHNKGSDLFAPMDNFLIILSLYNPKAEDSLDDAMMQSIKYIIFWPIIRGILKKIWTWTHQNCIFNRININGLSTNMRSEYFSVWSSLSTVPKLYCIVPPSGYKIPNIIRMVFECIYLIKIEMATFWLVLLSDENQYLSFYDRPLYHLWQMVRMSLFSVRYESNKYESIGYFRQW